MSNNNKETPQREMKEVEHNSQNSQEFKVAAQETKHDSESKAVAKSADENEGVVNKDSPKNEDEDADENASVDSDKKVLERQKARHVRNNVHNEPDFTKIDRSVINYKRHFSRRSGALSQVVQSLEDMIDRLNDPINPYQKGLYPKIQDECRIAVDEYDELVAAVDAGDNRVFGYYLNGHMNNGRRKATTTPHEQKIYGVSEYKETLKSIRDRLRHIRNNCLEKCKDKSRNDHDVLKRMINFCDNYYKHILQRFDAWDSFIADFRKANGVVKVNKSSSPDNSKQKDSSRKSKDDSTGKNKRVRRARRIRVRKKPRSVNDSNGKPMRGKVRPQQKKLFEKKTMEANKA